MKDTFNSTEKKITVVIICDPPDPVSGNKGLKYRNVDNSTPAKFNRFIAFAKKFPTAQYMNCYNKYTREYLGRILLNQKPDNGKGN